MRPWKFNLTILINVNENKQSLELGTSKQKTNVQQIEPFHVA